MLTCSTTVMSMDLRAAAVPTTDAVLSWHGGTLRGSVRSFHQLTLFELIQKLGQLRKVHPALRRESARRCKFPTSCGFP